MKRTKHQPLPEPVTRLRDQLSEFRATHPPRTRLPASLWQAAAELGREFGVYAVAHPLRLDNKGLKRRMGRVTPAVRMQRDQRTKATAFVELVGPVVSNRDTYVIEFESVGGDKMRIQWPASMPPDWTSLLRAWRETEG